MNFPLAMNQRFPLPLGTRQILHESCYFDHLHKSLRFHLATLEDLDQIRAYLTTIHKKFDLNAVQKALQQNWLILVTDYFEICGVLVGNVLDGEDGKLLQVEWVGTHPVYEKNHLIEQQLLIETFKYAFQQQVTQIQYSPSNDQSKNVAKKLGMKQEPQLNPFSEGTSNMLQIEMNELEALLTKEPQLPDAYLLDQSYSRRCLKRFTPKRLGRELRIEVVLVEDESVFRHFMFNEFMQQTPVNKRLQLSETESLEHFNTRLDSDQFKQGLCLVATDQGRICAAGACRPIHVTMEDRHQWQPIEVPMDLKEEADKISFSTQRSREAQAINVWMTAFVAQFLPPDCFDYMRVEMRSVHPYYIRCGIAGAVTEATDRVIRENGYKVFQTLYLANAMARKVEGKQAYPPVAVRFPYSQFKYNGRPTIPNGVTSDGGEFVTVNIGYVRQPLGQEKEEPQRLVAKL